MACEYRLRSSQIPGTVHRADTMELNIPKPVRGVLAAFGALGRAEVDRFVKAVQEAKPRLVVDEFAAEVASACGMPAEKVRSFVSAFFGMYLVRIQSGRSLEGFVSDLLAALQKTKDEISDPDSFSRCVKVLLQAYDSLGITAKAL